MRVLWVTVRMMLGARVLSAGLVGFAVNGRAPNGGVSRSYQERALTAELCGPTVLYGGGGRI
jgi:hypothetical protein